MKKIIILLFLLILFLIVSISSYADSVSKDLEDQDLKLKIRDKVISYINNLDYTNLSKEQIISLTHENITEIEKLVNSTIKENGYNYTCKLEIGNYYFPTKHYKNLSLPAGNYDALKINLGNAKGKNWWCSLYPPLCFTNMSTGIIDENSSEILKNNLTNDEYFLISKGNEKIKLKFKIVEIYENLKNK